MVRELLHEMGYSLQANRKSSEGKQHPDRKLQFEFINLLVEENLAVDNPVISVDAKKKELVGDFKNAGREWRPSGDPRQVNGKRRFRPTSANAGSFTSAATRFCGRKRALQLDCRSGTI